MSSAASLFLSAPINVVGVVKPGPFKPKPSKKIKVTLPQKKVLKEKRPFVDSNLSVGQVKEREDRTIFVGNVSLKTDKRKLMRFFKKFGSIEKLWARSLPLDLSSKINQKGKAILKKYSEAKSTKNCYIMYKDKESAVRATVASGETLDGVTLRVSLAAKKTEDFKTTIFVGNLPFVCEDEEVRTFFSAFGKVDYVRIIRDSMTQTTKGFGYVKFAEKQDWTNLMSIVLARTLSETKKLFKKYYSSKTVIIEGVEKNNEIITEEGLDAEGKIVFKGRQIRISKAKKTLVKSRRTRFQKYRDNAPKIGTGPRATQTERMENRRNVRAISKGVRMGTGGYDTNMMNNVIRNQVVAPQGVVSKRIKKIKRNVTLSKEEKVKLILKFKKTQSDKLRENVIETEGLLEKRRLVKKKKKKFNILAAKRAMKM